jgi:hypothetical protein
MRLNLFTITLMVIGIIYFLLDRSGALDKLIHRNGDINKMHKDESNKYNIVNEVTCDFPPGTFTGLMFTN